MTVLRWCIAALLLAFTARRYLYLFASLLPPRPVSRSRRFSILILGAFKNEELSLPHLLDALGAIDYPPSLLRFALISDGSQDRTPELLRAWVAARTNAVVLVSESIHGKGGALNLAFKGALDAGLPPDLVAVCDADTWPAPSHLSWLAGAFEDPDVAAASGLLLPANATRSLIARYSALETWIYQTVILAGKERCGANPPVVGSNSVYRRTDLEAAGGFPEGVFSEDIELSLAFVGRGRKARWIREAHASTLVATTLGRFFRQRARWTSGLYRSSVHARGLESWFTAAGYIDRLVFVVALVLTLLQRMQPGWIAVYLSAPFFIFLTAIFRAREQGSRWIYVLVAPVMFLVDIAASLVATFLHVIKRGPEWRTDRD